MLLFYHQYAPNQDKCWQDYSRPRKGLHRRAFQNGHWQFETAGPEWRTMHYIAGGQFHAIGEAIKVQKGLKAEISSE